MKRKVAIIGGGASGMMAAITSHENGAEVTIYEHNKLGKKILSTGNGKCNLSNRYMGKEYFFSHHMERVESCLERFGVSETIDFFKGLGLCIKEKNSYLYPLAEQASVVLQVLQNKIEKLKIPVIYAEKIVEISVVDKPRIGRNVMIMTENGISFYDALIIACGSKAAPKTGSDGSGYDIAKRLGHKLIPVLPALVQLKCSDSFCKEIAGIRADIRIHILDGSKELCTEEGELQLTDYGISGIPVFQLSGLVNRYLYENKKVQLVARMNFLPQMNDEEFYAFRKERISLIKEKGTAEDFFCGMLNQKLMKLFLKLACIHPETPINKVEHNKINKVFELCRCFEMHISGSNGFDHAQVCTGGVDLQDVTDKLESVYAPNIYFAGEILDVDGRCGGYNLQWAWTSGKIAGEAAAIGHE